MLDKATARTMSTTPGRAARILVRGWEDNTVTPTGYDRYLKICFDATGVVGRGMHRHSGGGVGFDPAERQGCHRYEE